jgi:hypothetical protein
MCRTINQLDVLLLSLIGWKQTGASICAVIHNSSALRSYTPAAGGEAEVPGRAYEIIQHDLSGLGMPSSSSEYAGSLQ